MKSWLTRVAVALVAVIALALPGVSQDSQKKKLKAATLDGTTGLFKAYDAETLLQGEFNFSVGVDHYNRDPNALVMRDFPIAFSVGLHDRIELFGSWIAQRHIDTINMQYYRLWPGMAPRPSTNLAGVTSFSQEAPFLDVPRTNGAGDVMLGGKFNFMSERKGDPLGVGFAVFTKLATSDDPVRLNRGLTTGAHDIGWAVLFSKRAAKVAQLHFNTGVNFVGNPEYAGAELADLQNEWIWRGGAAFPAYGPVQVIGEIDGRTYMGGRTMGANPRSPVDMIVGVRFFPSKWMTLGAGYQASFNHIKESGDLLPAGSNGFVAQMTLGRRINRPPTATCAVANATIKQADTTTVRASAVDPDNDELSYAWSTSGGKISGSGDSVTFDATGIAPGKYTVTATVSDGELSASCAGEITVLKRNEAPRVSCEPSSTSLTVGESATIRASASDPNNDSLTYTWTVNGQKLAADTPTITFGTTGREPGSYTVAVTVSDGELTATCSTAVNLRAVVKQNQPPRIEALTPTVDLPWGQTAQLAVRTSDPDGDPVTVTWSSSCGRVTGSGETVSFSADGAKAGICTVTATADDGRGGRASATMTVNVHEKINLNYASGSARLDNTAKAALDDIAVRMQNDPKLVATITGYIDGRESKRLGAARAKAVADYLQKKGIDASRLTVNDGGKTNPVGDDKTVAGRKLNRRAEIELQAR